MYRVRVRFLLSVQLKGSGGGDILFCFVCFVLLLFLFNFHIALSRFDLMYGISRQ